MRLWIAGLAALVLSGCASVTAVNDKGGIVEHTTSAKAALKVAETFCAKNGTTAKASDFSRWSETMTFECVPR